MPAPRPAADNAPIPVQARAQNGGDGSAAGPRAPVDTLKLEPRPRAGRILALTVHEATGHRRAPLPATGELVIGRGPEADLVIDLPSVSRRHARVLGGDVPALEDLGSTNGSWVNGTQLHPGRFMVLEEGAAVRLGDVVAVVENVVHAAQVAAGEAPDEVIVASAAMRAVHDRVRLFARGSCPILVLGETGTGKEVYSTIIVRMSPRAAKPFLRLNCAALPGDMVESELFGYERGAFTGAVAAKPGLLESAHGGTVLLDEAGDLSLRTQAKLLRALESGEILRLGAVRPRKVDVRLLAATNRDLARMVQEGSFRADLYYRLAGAEVTLPPLRERLEDLESLATTLLRAACASQGLAPKSLTLAALRRLAAHPWPGNVRELKSAIERAVLVTQGAEILPEHITFVGWVVPATVAPPPPFPAPPPVPAALPAPTTVIEITARQPARDLRRSAPADLPQAAPVDLRRPQPREQRPQPLLDGAPPAPLAGAVSDDFYHLRRERERASIVAALETCDGNQTQAAQKLGMPRRTFVKRLTEYGIRSPRRPDPSDRDE